VSRDVIPVRLRWRDAQGFVTHTRLYWAGHLYDGSGEGPGLLGDGTVGSFSPLFLLLDPSANDGIQSWLQACSHAKLEALLIPGVRDDELAFAFNGPPPGGPAYGVGGLPYGSIGDHLDVQWFTFVSTPTPNAPPVRWSFTIPAPAAACFQDGWDSGDPQAAVASTPLSDMIGQFNAFVSGSGGRFDAPGNETAAGWCTDRGVFLTNTFGAPYRTLPPRREVGLRQRAAGLTMPAL